MIVGGYVLDLYCDNVETGRCVATLSYQNEFCERNSREAMKAARRVGWSFKEDEAYCPSCTKARKR